MLKNQTIKELIQIDQNPYLLLEQANKVTSKSTNFMKNWYLMLKEYQINEWSYVWSLLYGWELHQLQKTLVTNPIQKNSQILKPFQISEHISSIKQIFLKDKSQNFLQFLSKKQAFIKIEANMIWINPSCFQSQFQSLQNNSIIVVITSANIKCLINLLIFHSKGKVGKLITTEIIYRKLKKLILFINTILAHENKTTLTQPITYLLKPQEHFEYGGIIWLLRQNCWFQPTYDLTITFKHTKISYLIQSDKLWQTKMIYYGWKKGLISQLNYQQYIREWQAEIIRPSKQKILYSIPRAQKIGKMQKSDWYLQFINKELIRQLIGVEQDDIFASCQLLELIPNQVIAKSGYIFDYLYILLQGQFEISENRDNPGNFPAEYKKIYGLQQLRKREKYYNLTLKSKSEAKIFRIQKHTLIFHLYDLMI